MQWTCSRRTARSSGIGNVQKGDLASCEGYRPILLLAIGYNLFATILLPRLKAAGADTIIWPTQFGFRAVRGCADALFVSMRALEQIYAAKKARWYSWPSIGQKRLTLYHRMASLSPCRGSVSQTLFVQVCNVQWSQSCGARYWAYVGTKAATF